ncbi:hypothetical protein HK104_008148, partial [Borealophlyctis nickersoniae]
MIAETVWLPYYIHAVRRLQERKPQVHAAKDKKSRKRLFERCFTALLRSGEPGSDPKETLRESIEGWFFGAPLEAICKENVESWLSWAFFDNEYHDLTPAHHKELDSFIARLEELTSHRFQPGFNPSVTCIRLTLDKLRATHRPMIYYTAIAAVNTFTQC